MLGVTVACARSASPTTTPRSPSKRSLGLAGRWKLAAARARRRRVLGYVAHHEGALDAPVLPLIDFHIDLGWRLVRARLPRGRGLHERRQPDRRPRRARAGTSAIAFLAYTRSRRSAGSSRARPVRRRLELPLRRPARRLARLDLAVFAAALLGGCIGFLWYNSFPAQVFMGDTGALGLGGALGALAVFTKTELLLPIIGGVFVVEALSVIIQVVSFELRAGASS